MIGLAAPPLAGLVPARVRWTPAVSVMIASLLASLPLIGSMGWWPPFGLMMLIAWRLLRADAWPAWWAAGLGLFDDLVCGRPIGLSMVTFTAAMLIMDLIDRRTEWRGWRVEWLFAALLIAAAKLLQWQVAVWEGAAVPLGTMLVPLFIATLFYPVANRLALRLDRWRLRRRDFWRRSS